MNLQTKRFIMMLMTLCMLWGIGISASAEVPANYTGIYQLQYYKKGQPVAVKGWVKYKNDYYYFKDGQAVTGWNYVKDLSGSSHSFKYYFSKTGVLSQDLFQTFGAKMRKKKMKIFVNLTTHNITICLYDSKTKGYNIPAKSWVCSTAKDGHSTKTGNYHLAKGHSSAWFIYKQSNPYHYYQYKVKIAGTRMLFHSEMYTGTSKNKLVARTYNGLGTNQTTRCIRSQAGNAYLIYRIAKENKYQVPVKIYRSKNQGPFGKKTLANSGGKIKLSQKYDPTDPKYVKAKKK